MEFEPPYQLPRHRLGMGTPLADVLCLGFVWRNSVGLGRLGSQLPAPEISNGRWRFRRVNRLPIGCEAVRQINARVERVKRNDALLRKACHYGSHSLRMIEIMMSDVRTCADRDVVAHGLSYWNHG